ncbi:MAG: PhoH family protein [Gammaproteobacteria bacterium]
MKKPKFALEVLLEPFDNHRLSNLAGKFDEHLKQIERYWKVEIHSRGNLFQITGPKRAAHKASEVLQKLYQETAHNHGIHSDKIHLIMQQINKNLPPRLASTDFKDCIVYTREVKIKPRSPNQYHYIKNILSHDINFGIGPAGTGKTYLAVALAVAALEQGKVQRIILVRPAVEAGEKLGFLPGDLSEKIDPYLRPLYDALYEMLGVSQVEKLIFKNVIEVAPLAYMRGRTLSDAFVILDEGQNTTREQMKMFLTRIGFGSKVVVTGDITQIDLPKPDQSGLRHAIAILGSIPEIHFTFFQATDVVRHPLVQLIIQAYEKSEPKNHSA